MAHIIESGDVPDSTYFRTGDAEPEINKDGSITILNGQGRRRNSWGAPGVTSTIVVDAPDFAAVHIGFHHKHGGGQFWRFYAVNGETTQLAWKDLDDETRQVVLDAAEGKAPRWAKAPGKLRKDYARPNPRANLFTGYKIVHVTDDGRMVSLYDGRTEYTLGKTLIERARPNHNGGFYSYPDGAPVMKRYKAGDLIGTPTAGRKALLKCECWGTRQYYFMNGEQLPEEWLEDERPYKVASTYCKPVEIVTEFEIA